MTSSVAPSLSRQHQTKLQLKEFDPFFYEGKFTLVRVFNLDKICKNLDVFEDQMPALIQL